MYPTQNPYPQPSAPYNQQSNGGYPSGTGYPNQAGYPPQPGYSSQSGFPSQTGYPNQPNFNMPNPSGYPPQSGFPQQPGYGFNQPNNNYPPQPGQMPYNTPGYAPPQPTPSYSSGNRLGGPWDIRSYLRQIFDEIDTNRNGQIAVTELHEALRRGQPNAQFDPRTVTILIEKYDRNRNGQIGFDEFHDLFVGINNQFNEFLDMDRDMSGFIDGNELFNALRQRGYNMTHETVHYIVNEMSRRNSLRGINFDLYVRTIARLDFLRYQHQANHLQNQIPFDAYARSSFF